MQKISQKYGGLSAIQIQDMLGIIEVKKWSSPKMLKDLHEKFRKLEEKLKAQLEERMKAQLEEQSNNRIKRKIRIFFVTFRFRDGEKEWKLSKEEDLGIDYSYAFFGNYTKHPKNKDDKKLNRYPWEEVVWNNFADSEYAGNFEKLIKDINNL